jgi:signal transduction histidine kinase
MEKYVVTFTFSNFGGLQTVGDTPLTEASLDILSRFGKVFDLTYTRFNDLKLAEAQAREAQIEAALEKIRSRSLAMRHSDELREVIAMVYIMLSELKVKHDTIAIQVFDFDTKSSVLWPRNTLQNVAPKVVFPYDEDIMKEDTPHRALWEAMATGKSIINKVYSKQQKDRWFEYIFAHNDYTVVEEHSRQFLLQLEILTVCFFPEKYSGLYAESWDGTKYSEEDIDVLKRAARVFEQAYVRFLDLQKAEVQTLEAIKRASVDRVRAEIASMRTTKDLERITPLIWNELTTLGVPFIRCGVFIMDEEKQQIETHLSTPGGEAIATFNLSYNAPGIPAEMVAHWHKKELYKQHWNESEFIEFTQNLVQQGAITSGEKYLTENRPTDLYLHFLPFLQGMLYAGNTSLLNDDELQLMQNLADAFSTAYARYEDFNKLEAAKRTVENTLTDLKQAQQQLVQSEKMASLGELTAGIAHEIQNPLNFVNNFSEINQEMIDEATEEINKGNYEEAKIILSDIKDNSEKINHHGQRADGIVKGMLQHSRSSSGQKELTDINTLCDEYLRLAYHGLRAKDKTFNASAKTEFDDSIGKINIVPQEIGRVILNLINNAFYAVSERKLKEADNYEPVVTVSTAKQNGKVEIRVRDNGNGIPQKILDKIFQPFFTTKPTGQGTGLGLSLAYDIIKAHNGEIKVETIDKRGSEFIISIPNNK